MTTNNTLYLPASSREFKDFGFMQAHLCFKPHLTPERQHFGSLITIDDATMKPAAQGFGFHPHQDVEVVTFMLAGEVKHIDPKVAEHNGTLKAKGIQIITSGTGIVHNEVNHSDTEVMRALQIWFTPREAGLQPHYARQQLEAGTYNNQLTCVLSPDGRDNSLVIQQDACLNYGLFDRAETLTHQPHRDGNYSFVYVVEGTAEVMGQQLKKGDGFGVLNSDVFTLDIVEQAELLVFDVAQH